METSLNIQSNLGGKSRAETAHIPAKFVCRIIFTKIDGNAREIHNENNRIPPEKSGLEKNPSLSEILFVLDLFCSNLHNSRN